MEHKQMTNKQLKAFLQSLIENIKKAKDLNEIIELLEKMINEL